MRYAGVDKSWMCQSAADCIRAEPLRTNEGGAISFNRKSLPALQINPDFNFGRFGLQVHLATRQANRPHPGFKFSLTFACIPAPLPKCQKARDLAVIICQHKTPDAPRGELLEPHSHSCSKTYCERLSRLSNNCRQCSAMRLRH